MKTKRFKLTNIGQLVTFNPESQRVESYSDVELLIQDDTILQLGRNTGPADETFDCSGRLVTPGFVDPHTHPVFVAGRQNEFELRLKGASYREIAKQGGGIQASVRQVRGTSEEELYKLVAARMDRFLAFGTTTIEAKSGYGLDTDSELKSLRVLEQVNRNHPIDIVSTFLGAHAFPEEFADNHLGYVDLICDEMIPAVAEQGIAKYCDVFCEKGYFSVEQSKKILNAAKLYGLIPRLHADEFVDSGAAELAAEIGAVSADHLMAVSDVGIRALKNKEVVATLLPGTTFFLGMSTWAPARQLIDSGVKLALATDFNPGSCNIQSMPFILSLACIYMGMSVEEAFQAATWQSAQSLCPENMVGTLEVGRRADLIIWDLDQLIEIPYFVSDVPLKKVMKSGIFVS